MTTQTPTRTTDAEPEARYASPSDIGHHGRYTVPQDPDDPRPLLRFNARLGTAAHPWASDRYHLYAGWFCPWAHRSTATVALSGLEEHVSISFVHGERDGRGWAFRQETGHDPVNGFTLLRQAFETTDPGFDGHVSVPVLWDRAATRIVSNDIARLDIDLALLAEHVVPEGAPGVRLYPEHLRTEIDELERWLLPSLNHAGPAALGSGPDANRARTTLLETLAVLDTRLSGRRYLTGEQVTLADLRVLVSLVRLDAATPAGWGFPRLADLPDLWDYARHLLHLPGLASTTRFAAFTPPSGRPSDWDTRAHRDG